MNPAHIIRECLTDSEWGMGYSESDIDDDSFIAAADTLYDEQMGISMLWQRENTIEAFVQDIIRHIDAALYVDRRTGKFVLKLIRDDYSESDLITLGPDEIERVENYKRPAFGDLVNSVTVIYEECEDGLTDEFIRREEEREAGDDPSGPGQQPECVEWALYQSECLSPDDDCRWVQRSPGNRLPQGCFRALLEQSKLILHQSQSRGTARAIIIDRLQEFVGCTYLKPDPGNPDNAFEYEITDIRLPEPGVTAFDWFSVPQGTVIIGEGLRGIVAEASCVEIRAIRATGLPLPESTLYFVQVRESGRATAALIDCPESEL